MENVDRFRKRLGTALAGRDWRFDFSARILEPIVVPDTLDRYLETIGGNALEGSYRELPLVEAITELTSIVRYEPVFNAEVVMEKAAEEIARGFYSLFCADVRAWSNREWIGKGMTYMCITTATFEMGMVAMDDTHAGMLWFFDED